jgi:hypothetical protein
MGHFPVEGVLGLTGVVGVLGVGVLGEGFGQDPHPQPHAVARGESMRLMERKRTTASVALDVIFFFGGDSTDESNGVVTGWNALGEGNGGIYRKRKHRYGRPEGSRMAGWFGPLGVSMFRL